LAPSRIAARLSIGGRNRERSVAPGLTCTAEGLPRRRFIVAEVEAMVEAGIMDQGERVERKAKLYASFGVRELWVIDAVKLTTRGLRVPSASGYGETRDFAVSEKLVPEFAPVEFALALSELKLA
jgi:Putative restriction endonuclease